MAYKYIKTALKDESGTSYHASFVIVCLLSKIQPFWSMANVTQLNIIWKCTSDFTGKICKMERKHCSFKISDKLLVRDNEIDLSSN